MSLEPGCGRIPHRRRSGRWTRATACSMRSVSAPARSRSPSSPRTVRMCQQQVLPTFVTTRTAALDTVVGGRRCHRSAKARPRRATDLDSRDRCRSSVRSSVSAVLVGLFDTGRHAQLEIAHEGVDVATSRAGLPMHADAGAAGPRRIRRAAAGPDSPIPSRSRPRRAKSSVSPRTRHWCTGSAETATRCTRTHRCDPCGIRTPDPPWPVHLRHCGPGRPAGDARRRSGVLRHVQRTFHRPGVPGRLDVQMWSTDAGVAVRVVGPDDRTVLDDGLVTSAPTRQIEYLIRSL